MRTDDCLVLILGGGRGTRLFPLTQERSKPAIGFAGKYRLIDIPVSNCINSGYNKIFIITQFLSASLHGHLMQAYRFDHFSRGFVEILSAEQGLDHSEWFQGTADAVRQILRHLRTLPQERILILSGDHLYKMDFRLLEAFHAKAQAEVTIASVLVEAREATRMGLLDCGPNNRVRRMVEKPTSPGRLNLPAVNQETGSGVKKFYRASMGIYLFEKSVLIDVLTKTKAEDFGKHVLPGLVKKQRKVFAYDFPGYWVDIGTVKSYYDATMDLLGENPRFELFDEKWPFFTRSRFLPPSKVVDATLRHSFVADGSQISSAHVEHSVIGLRTRIMAGARITRSIIMGNDYYERWIDGGWRRPFIGHRVQIERAIIDKNATIGDNCRITSKEGKPDEEHALYCVKDGITIVRRGAVLKPNTII